jgi:hypothetical protein
MAMEIGRDCKWTDIIAQVFHILEFDRAGTKITTDGKVKSKSIFKPYGYLLVESPIFNLPAKLPIVHRDDFLLASSVFDEPRLLEVIKESELLVTYLPEHKLPGGAVGTAHGLHYVIVPMGTLKRYYDFNNDFHMSHPAPEKIFGNISWHGEIKVKVNPEPML